MIITCIRKRFHVFLHAAITLYPLEKKHPLLCKIIYHTSSSPHIPNIRAFLPFQDKSAQVLLHQQFPNIRAFLPFQGKNSPPMPIHSGGETPGTDRLIPGAGFLLARRRMRWIAADTCLSAASCVRSYPPLAFFCKPRGTLPESTKRPRPESPRRVPPYSFIPGRNTIAPRYPNNSAPLIPTALAVNPHLKIPSTPSSLIAFTTPFHSVFPNPKSGTVAPAPAHSANGS